MSREIKFRGQTRRKGEYVINMAGDKCKANWVYGGIFPQNNGGDFAIIYEQPSCEKRVVYANTVGQYTGETDKKGKEIYDGDICKFFDNTYNANLLGIVKFGQYKQDGSGCEYPPTPVIGFYVEIIKYQFTEDSLYDDEDKYPEWNMKMSLLEAMDENTYFDFEVIGNVYENVDLLKEVEQK